MANDETLDSTNLPQREQDMATEQMRPEQWLALRKKAGLQIDPNTAEVFWTYAQTFDPYASGHGSGMGELPERALSSAARVLRRARALHGFQGTAGGAQPAGTSRPHLA
jgi:hypothetical protein